MSEEKKTFEPKSFKVEGFGEITRRANGDFIMSQADMNKFFADQGLADYQEFKKKESAIGGSFVKYGVNFLKDQAIADDRDVVLKAGMGNNRIDINFKRCSVGKNPRTGEETRHYGVVSVRKRYTPDKELTNGFLDEVAKETEAAFKKAHPDL